MSDRLRRTAEEYANEIKRYDQELERNTLDRIRLETERSELVEAKVILDKQIAKLPAPKEEPAPAAP